MDLSGHGRFRIGRRQRLKQFDSRRGQYYLCILNAHGYVQTDVCYAGSVQFHSGGTLTTIGMQGDLSRKIRDRSGEHDLRHVGDATAGLLQAPAFLEPGLRGSLGIAFEEGSAAEPLRAAGATSVRVLSVLRS